MQNILLPGSTSSLFAAVVLPLSAMDVLVLTEQSWPTTCGVSFSDPSILLFEDMNVISRALHKTANFGAPDAGAGQACWPQSRRQ